MVPLPVGSASTAPVGFLSSTVKYSEASRTVSSSSGTLIVCVLSFVEKMSVPVVVV